MNPNLFHAYRQISRAVVEEHGFQLPASVRLHMARNALWWGMHGPLQPDDTETHVEGPWRISLRLEMDSHPLTDHHADCFGEFTCGRVHRYGHNDDCEFEPFDSLENMARYQRRNMGRHDAWLWARREIQRCREIMDRYEHGAWGYVGMVVVVAGCNVMSEASLWGIDSGLAGSQWLESAHLGDTAQDLVAECIHDCKRQIQRRDGPTMAADAGLDPAALTTGAA